MKYFSKPHKYKLFRNKINKSFNKVKNSAMKVDVVKCYCLSFPSLDSALGRLPHNIRSAILGDQGSVLLHHHQHGDPLHSVLLLQIVGESGVVLHPAPVPVGLLHVGDHVIGGSVAGHEDYLQVIRDLSVEVTQHGGELPAGRTPVGREVVEDEVLVLQSLLSLHLAAISLHQSCSAQ